jgi:glutathione S-transferase
MLLWNSPPSGNCYKVRLLLAHLNLSYETIDVDVTSDIPEELQRLNPAGQVPLLILDDGRALAESNAILWHLAQQTKYLADEPVERQEVLRWLFFEQNAHEPNIATSRFIITYAKTAERFGPVLEYLARRGHAALAAMESQLADRPFFAGRVYSIADIALYAYTHAADEGRFELQLYPRVRAWLDRVRAQPGHVPLRS